MFEHVQLYGEFCPNSRPVALYRGEAPNSDSVESIIGCGKLKHQDHDESVHSRSNDTQKTPELPTKTNGTKIMAREMPAGKKDVPAPAASPEKPAKTPESGDGLHDESKAKADPEAADKAPKEKEAAAHDESKATEAPASAATDKKAADGGDDAKAKVNATSDDEAQKIAAIIAQAGNGKAEDGTQVVDSAAVKADPAKKP